MIDTIKDILEQLAAYAKVYRNCVLDELLKSNGNLTKAAKMFDTNFYEIKDIRNGHSSASNQYACERLLYYYEHKGKHPRDPVDAKIAHDTSPKPWDKLPGKNK